MGSQDFEVEGCKASGSESEIDWITLEEVEGLLRQQALSDTEGFRTTLEWAKHWGIGTRTAGRKIAGLVKLGVAEARKVFRRNSLGHACWIQGYRIEKPEPASAQ